jgi:hypothetical protein
MEKRTLVIVASVSVVAAIGTYLYFNYKDKQRQKVYETVVSEEDALKSLWDTATEESKVSYEENLYVSNDYYLPEEDLDLQQSEIESGMGDY